MQNSANIPSIFISYAWNSESEKIAELIEKEFQRRDIYIVRDKSNLPYTGRIKEFMGQLGQGKYVILVVNDKYLRSENCMFELLQVFKNKDFYERIYPIVLEDAKIAKASDRLDLVKFWEEEAKKLDSKIRELNELSNIQSVTDDLNLYTDIRNNIARLTGILKDMNTLSINQHLNSGFQQIYELINEKIRADFKGSERKTVKYTKKPNIALIVGVTVLVSVVIVVYRSIEPVQKKGVSIPEVTAKKSMTSEVEDTSDLEAKSKDQQAQATTSGEEKGSKTFSVEMVVPSHMTMAKVFVNNSEAEVIERNLTFIKIRVPQSPSSHHFLITDGLDSCATEALINKEGELLSMCN